MRLEFQDGNWIEVTDVADLRDADRQAVNAAITLVIDGEGRRVVAGSYEDDMRKAMYRRIVTNWSFQQPLPSKDPRGVGNLTLAQGRELRELTKPHFDALAEKVNPNETGTDPTEGSES